GHKEQYQQFSNTIYMCILPKLNLIRREGEDIEYFHLASVQKHYVFNSMIIAISTTAHASPMNFA
ncbi:hypothetical protein ONJ17_26935, partial [Salmonella enterica subsp. enterica serovar Agona]|nr:hypothetical protein [Salmonella enterica subsp. enterica serovar Agona]